MRVVLWVAVVLPGAGGCAPKGEVFTSEEGRFRVSFPGTPTVEALNDPARPDARKASLTTRHGALTLVWESVKEGLSDGERLDRAADEAVSAANGKARWRKKLPLAGDDRAGREVLVETQDGKLIQEVRLYVHKGRLYRLTAAGPAWWIESPEARLFLRSFEVPD
jgi:hypothetical protein